MSAALLTPPAIEPWTVADAKAFLRIETDDDDAIVSSLIAAARGQVEALARCLMIAQRWRVTLDTWPHDGTIKVRLAPLRGIAAARVFDAQGNAASIDPDRLLIGSLPGLIHVPSWELPRPGRAARGIELDLDIGFGPKASDVPDVLRHAVRTLVSHWYDNRGLLAIGGSVAAVPGSVNAMIASYRTLSL